MLLLMYMITYPFGAHPFSEISNTPDVAANLALWAGTSKYFTIINKNIPHLPANAFGNITHRITGVELAWCGMETVHDYAFYGLYNITSLRLLYNNLTEAPKLHSLKETLKLLDFLGNEIFYIPRDYFAGFVKLNFLNLSKNKLTTFPNIEYAALQMSLSSVRIYSNKIKRVNRLRPETKFIALDTLKLTNNSLEAFDIDFLKHFGLLGLHIYLDGNNLTTLGNLDNIAKTSDLILFLGNNPWKCCEDLSWMPTFGIGSNSRISWNMIEDPPPVCAKPDHLRGSNVLTLDFETVGPFCSSEGLVLRVPEKANWEIWLIGISLFFFHMWG